MTTDFREKKQTKQTQPGSSGGGNDGDKETTGKDGGGWKWSPSEADAPPEDKGRKT